MLLDTKNLKKIILKDHVSILQIINNLNLSGLKVVIAFMNALFTVSIGTVTSQDKYLT